ncbi:hypothetical protein V6N11_072776 [Hibiscus sabdariffa]|uniref:Uncharacterized protein n=2 Tax=Hibiscus sabdariffa TaxID=183260 RepID=A0ABR2C6C4_9ROSI
MISRLYIQFGHSGFDQAGRSLSLIEQGHSMVFNVLVTFGIYDQFFARELLVLRNGCGPRFLQLGSSKAAQL